MGKMIINSKKYGQRECFFDDSDSHLISVYNWCLKPDYRNNLKFYACSAKMINGKQKSFTMHRLLCSNWKIVDHRDGNGLNNTRANLREVSHTQNLHNMGISVRNTSGYKGVHKRSKTQGWEASIRVNKILIRGGIYDTPLEAARIYNEMALKYFGEFACINKI